jgi:hypothetical protein
MLHAAMITILILVFGMAGLVALFSPASVTSYARFLIARNLMSGGGFARRFWTESEHRLLIRIMGALAMMTCFFIVWATFVIH